MRVMKTRLGWQVKGVDALSRSTVQSTDFLVSQIRLSEVHLEEKFLVIRARIEEATPEMKMLERWKDGMRKLALRLVCSLCLGIVEALSLCSGVCSLRGTCCSSIFMITLDNTV